MRKSLERMIIEIHWELGDITRTYSPKGRRCKSGIRKAFGWFFVTIGGSILFGGKDSEWKTYINSREGEE